MLHFEEFDAKTGKPITDFNPEGERTPRIKEVSHSYLEKWLSTRKIEPVGLYMARFYDGVLADDRQRREAEGKTLIFTSGGIGYFTDPETATLIAKGDAERGIEPIYAFGGRSAHNLVAYGSLVSSDGVIDAGVVAAKILVIDDEQRFAGDAVILDKDGFPVLTSELEQLYDKMGDGTMLLTNNFVRNLLLDQEILGAIGKALDETLGHDIDPFLPANLLQEFRENGRVSNYLVSIETARLIERWIDRTARSLVVQFRAASPDLPGIAKGTASTSTWCDRLGVAAIVSTNDIKGDDGRFSTPGLRELNSFWINRKSLAEWSDQSVGPQVKLAIPEATFREISPLMATKAQEVARAAVDPWQMVTTYVAKASRKRELEIDISEGAEDAPRSNKDAVYKVLQADKYGQLSQLPNINRQMERSLRTDWLDVAIAGITIPAAMAQHHSQLEPWEICNRDLPHGAIVAYFRSPFPNIGAAAIGINNLDAIRETDQEAFGKKGVAYLNPWTAKNIAITDFDADRNGFFLGYLGNERLPAQLREQLAGILDAADQYEAGRAAFEEIIDKAELVELGDYPLAVREFITGNTPENKPLLIAKAKKQDHHWQQEAEPLAAAIWRAWQVTAENPIAKVANQSMVLQSYALETQFIDRTLQPQLLMQIAAKYAEISADQIPTDEYLQSQGLPTLGLAAKLKTILQASREITGTKDPAKKEKIAVGGLQEVYSLLKNFCDGPVAKNLQTAVDSAKSRVGIDEEIQAFGKLLTYKHHQMRASVKKPDTYLTGALPTNTQEPVGWQVQTVNSLYQGSRNCSQIQSEDLNRRFRSLLPVEHDRQQSDEVTAVANTYNQYINMIQRVKERLRKELPEDRQPTLTITSSTGRSLVIQRLCDAEKGEFSPVWDIGNVAKVYINANKNSQDNERYVVRVEKSGKIVGFISPQSIAENNLSQFDSNFWAGKDLVITNPDVEFHAPYFLQNDVDMLFARSNQVLDDFSATVAPGQEAQYASAAWHTSVGMGIAIKLFPDQITAHLDAVNNIALTDCTSLTKDLADRQMEIMVRFDRLEGKPVAVAIEEDGTTQLLGSNTKSESPLLAPGTVVRAKILRPLDAKIRITTERGMFAVHPIERLRDRAIEPMEAELIFRKAATGQGINVYISQNGTRSTSAAWDESEIGVLDLSSAKAFRNLRLSTERPYHQLTGSLSRGLHTSNIEVQVLELIAHQPVAEILAGERLPLPSYQKPVPEEEAGLAQISVGSYEPSIRELKAWQQATAFLGQEKNAKVFVDLLGRLDELSGDEKNLGFRHPDVAIPSRVKDLLDAALRKAQDADPAGRVLPYRDVSIDHRYCPSMAELRACCLAQRAAGDREGFAATEKLGLALAELFQGEGKSPGHYSNPAVSISLEEKQKLEALLNPPEVVGPVGAMQSDMFARANNR
jgi:hypothetical protein